MARNGSGTFNRLYDWTDERDAGNNIDATKMDAEMDGMATALTESIAKDGQTTPTADLPMGGFKHTGVDDGTARTHYTRLDQAQDGKLAWADSGGTADAITATYSPALTALVDGQLCYVRAGAANATTTPTFSPNGLTARTIVKEGGSALVAGDIVGDGHELVLRYDLSNTRWELLNPSTTAGTQADVITTRGDMIRGSSAGVAERLALGARGGIVHSDGTDLAYLAVGDAGEVLESDGTDPSWGARRKVQTAIATTSGTAHTVTSIPSWVTRISVNLAGLSTSGTSNLVITLGTSSGLETSDYLAAVTNISGATPATANSTAAFALTQAIQDTSVLHGRVVLELEDAATNKWTIEGGLGFSNGTTLTIVRGSKALGGTLDRISLTTAGGSDTFDAGSFSVTWE